VIVGLKFLVDLFDVLCTLVVYITYNIGNRDFPDIYALAIGPAALSLEIYSARITELVMLASGFKDRGFAKFVPSGI